MWWSDRRTFLILPLLAAGACGFTPVYAPGGTGALLQDKVAIQAPGERESYLLVQELEQRLGRSVAPAYDLSFELETVVEGQAVTASGDTTRYSLVGQADYRLVPRGSQTPVASGSVRNFTGYSATGSTVETLASERDAKERLMIILADQMVTQIYATARLPE